jgi:hypothetical protein
MGDEHGVVVVEIALAPSPMQAPATWAMASSPVSSTTCSLRVSTPLAVSVKDL